MNDASSPILVVPYMWIGDFVRCHTVVRLLCERFPHRPIDLLANPIVAPLLDFMPGVRKGIVFDLPRKRLAFSQHRILADLLRPEKYGDALMMPRTWKSALAPYLAGIPRRTGFLGEMRFGLVNDRRSGEKVLPRMIERCAALALPKGAALPPKLPPPRFVVPAHGVSAWRRRIGVAASGRAIVALAPGAVGPSKRWPAFGPLATNLLQKGFEVWIVGGPDEKALTAEIMHHAPRARDLTGSDIRDAVMALAAATVVISNDSGLLHVAAAIGTPSIGIFGPTSPWHWGPLNPLAATIKTEVPCGPCHEPVCRLHHHQCMHGIPVEWVVSAVREAAGAELGPALIQPL